MRRLGEGIHPAIMGLVQELPPVGSVWPKVERERWLHAMEAVFAVVYPGPRKAPAKIHGIRVVEVEDPRAA